MKLEVTIPDELFDQHSPEDTLEEDAIEEALIASLTESSPLAEEITARKLNAPHRRLLDTWTYDGWEEGEPCPDCGASTVRVHFVDIMEFTSEGGDFEYENYCPEPGEAPQILWQCAACSARLKDSVPGTYFF